MSEVTIRNAVRAALVGATAMAASMGWAQAPEQPATTQGPAVTDTTTPNTPGTQTLDEQKLDQFADAYVAVQQIQANAAAEIDSAAGDPAKQQATQAKIESEMIAAVERSGLKLEEFNGIIQTLSADSDLRARVVAKIREKMGG
jgi:hypothetical protein